MNDISYSDIINVGTEYTRLTLTSLFQHILMTFTHIPWTCHLTLQHIGVFCEYLAICTALALVRLLDFSSFDFTAYWFGADQ